MGKSVTLRILAARLRNKPVIIALCEHTWPTACCKAPIQREVESFTDDLFFELFALPATNRKRKTT